MKAHASLFTCVIVVVVVVTWFCGEPRYHWHTLTHWIRASTMTDGLCCDPDGDNVRTEAEMQEARVAVQAIGPRGFPTLLRLLKPEDPAWKPWLNELLEKQDMVRVRFHFADERHNAALTGISILGSNAAPLIPELTAMLMVSNTARRAALALGCIGPDSLPVLRAGLKNTNREICFASYGGLQGLKIEDAKGVIPELLELRKRTDIEFQIIPLTFLRYLMTKPEYVPLLRESIQDPNMRSAGVHEASLMGTNARPVVPLLLELLADPSLTPGDRIKITNIVRRADPVAAAAAGVNTNALANVPRSTRRRRP